MKKHFKYLLLLLIISCSTKKNIQTFDSFKLKLPKETVKITAKSLDSISKLDQKIIGVKNIYKINNVYLAMGDPYKGEVKEGLLENHKNGSDYRMKAYGYVESHQYKSSIEKINNNDALVMYEYYENIGQYIFKIKNPGNTQILGGMIVFENESNYDEATKILNDLLRSVQFE